MRILPALLVIFTFTATVHAQYYHPFQNFDDDVDGRRASYNLFGGNYAIINDDDLFPQFSCSRDTLEVRTGYGRSLKFIYGPLTRWSMYVESFKRDWWDCGCSFDLCDLFPDYTDSGFQGRQIDSLVFYCKLDAVDTLTIKLELHDASNNTGFYQVDISPSDEWKCVSVALDQFEGPFNPCSAKFLGLTFAQEGNENESGILYADDFYLVEAGYSKPVFTSGSELLDYINKVNFRHLWMAVEPESKFALDQHIYGDLISVDAIGFQLSSYTIAHRHGWIDTTKIQNRVAHILDYLLHVCQHGDKTSVESNPTAYATVEGNWAHFLDAVTKARKNTNTEFSLFTNALLLSGVLVCREYFHGDPVISAVADSLYRMVDWNFFYIPGNQLMYYSWLPESGYSESYTNWFTEEIDLAFLLAISAPDTNHRIPVNPFFAPGYAKPYCYFQPDGHYIYSWPGANFTYYFLQMYAGYEPGSGGGVGRFDNARNALLRDLIFCRNAYEYMAYDTRIFGTTACAGPDSSTIGRTNYHAYGYPCREDTANVPNGTVAVYGSGAATLFIPDQAIACLDYYYNDMDSLFTQRYGYAFWSPIFGFPDAFHLSPDKCGDEWVNGLHFNGPWLSVPRFGIDVGPMLINIDSYLSEKAGFYDSVSVRVLFSGSEYVLGNLAEFDPVFAGVDDECGIVPSARLYQNYPNPCNPVTTISYELPKRCRVRLAVFDAAGKRVRVLLDGAQSTGINTITWDGMNEQRETVSSGVYFYCLLIDGKLISRKLVMLR